MCTIAEFLIILALLLVIIEFIISTGGIFAFSGLVSFLMALTLIFLLRLPIPYIFLYITVPSFLILLILSVVIIILAYKAQRKKPLIGDKSMVGKAGKCIKMIAPPDSGQVEIEGEIWEAFSDEKINISDMIVVVDQDSLKLKVKKISKNG